MHDSMIRVFIKKVFILLLSLGCVVTVTFFLVHSLPGDPFIGESDINPEVLLSLRAHYGLDEPLWLQYLKYVKNLASFDLGPSIASPGRSVNELIWRGFSVSALLGLEALLIAVVLGLILGILSASKSGRFQGEIANVFSCIGLSIPIFVLAALLQWFFSIYLGWLPVARWGTLAHSILPAISLAALPAASIARLTRTSLLEAFEQDYIQAAKAKGLPFQRILWRHAIKNALFPVVTYLGPASVYLLTGSFIVEKIFCIPGMGQTMIRALAARDYSVVLGLTIFLSSLLMLSSFIVDLVCSKLNPKHAC